MARKLNIRNALAFGGAGTLGAVIGLGAIDAASHLAVKLGYSVDTNSRSRAVSIDKFFPRVGALGGIGGLSSQNDESITVKIELPLVRKNKTAIKVIFERKDRVFFEGDTRIAQLMGAEGLEPEPITSCMSRQSLSDNNRIACVEAPPARKILKTGWIIRPRNETERLIIDFTQFLGKKPPKERGGEASDRYESDDFSELALVSGTDRFFADEDDPEVSVGDIALDFRAKTIDFGPMITHNRIGLTARQEGLLYLLSAVICALLGPGILWRFSDRLKVQGSVSQSVRSP